MVSTELEKLLVGTLLEDFIALDVFSGNGDSRVFWLRNFILGHELLKVELETLARLKRRAVLNEDHHIPLVDPLRNL